MSAELARDFVAAGYHVTVLTQVPSYPDDAVYAGFVNKGQVEESSPGLVVHRVRTLTGYKDSRIRKVLAYLNFMVRATLALGTLGNKFDAVFVYQTGPLTQALPLCFQKKAKGHRVLWTQDIWPDAVYEYGFPPKGIFKFFLERFVGFIYRHCDVVAVSSPGFLPGVAAMAQKSRVLSIPQWAPAEVLSGYVEGIQPQEGTRVLRFAGTLGTMQNLDTVIRAFQRARKVDPRLELELYGNGSERDRLLELVRTMDYTGIRFMDRVPMGEVMPLLQSAHALLLPLVGQGTVAKTVPAKFQAYLAAGRPILGIVSGTVADIIVNEELGLCAAPDNEDAIAAACIAMAAIGNQEAQDMGGRSRTYLATHYDKAKIVARFLACLEGL